MTPSELIKRLEREIPGFRIRFKPTSPLWKHIAPERYTTYGTIIWAPSAVEWLQTSSFSKIRLILHEAEHMRQYKAYGNGIYLMLYLLAPLPIGFAYYRYSFERDAYVFDLVAYRLFNYPSPFIKARAKRYAERLLSGKYGYPNIIISVEKLTDWLYHKAVNYDLSKLDS